MSVKIKELLEIMIREGASDLHLTAGSPPLIRVDGFLNPIGHTNLNQNEVMNLTYSIMNESQRKRFEENKSCDFSFGLKDLSRYRANAYIQRGSVACAIRAIPLEIASFESLGLPMTVADLANKKSGLVLITGATGSGKSTTLAALIDKINRERAEHILTIEDPIEFVHTHNRCMINQREVLSDTNTFADALKYALRQDPDVVLIGEMRDLETMRSALTLAETGHLTFATLHTNSAVQSISRIVDSFPTEEQPTIRAQLAMVLQGVVSQQLLPKMGGGRILAYEIMCHTPAISSLIRDDKLHQIEGTIEVSAKFGMNTMNARLAELVKQGRITRDVALARTLNPEQLERTINGM